MGGLGKLRAIVLICRRGTPVICSPRAWREALRRYNYWRYGSHPVTTIQPILQPAPDRKTLTTLIRSLPSARARFTGNN